MVLKGQVIGIQSHLECVSNISALRKAPGFVMDDAFAVRASRIGTVFVFVMQHGLFGDWHRNLLDSHSTDFMVEIRTAGVYHCHPHWQRTESDKRNFFNTALQTAHDLIHITFLLPGAKYDLYG